MLEFLTFVADRLIPYRAYDLGRREGRIEARIDDLLFRDRLARAELVRVGAA